jgi:hypothetical protein
VQRWKDYIPVQQTYEALGDLDDDDDEILGQCNEENEENDIGRHKGINEERQRNTN